MVTVTFDTPVMQNEVAFIRHGQERLKSEVIRIRGNLAEMQVYEATTGLKIGEEVEFTGELLSIELGPGMLGQIYDGLQNPLPEIAEQCGFFLQRGVYIKALSESKTWDFTPEKKPGDSVRAGDKIGYVEEKIFRHYCMVPFTLTGNYEIISIENAGRFTIRQAVAQIMDQNGKIYPVFLSQTWPVKITIQAYTERLKPEEPLVTKMRLIDSLFPVSRGGTYCIPGPFGAGKTVLQQLISRHAEVDIVIIAACGERAGEIVALWYGLDAGEVIYRCFMGFFGLFFPAYVWLCMLRRSPSRRTLRIFAVAVVAAMPLFFAGFVAGRMVLLVPGVAIVLLARLARTGAG